MSCPFAFIALGFAAGIALQICFKFTIGHLGNWIFFGGAALPLLGGRRIFWMVLFLQMVFLGAACVRINEKRPLNAVESFAPQECASLEGIVADLPGIKQKGKGARVQFVLSTERLLHLNSYCPDARKPVEPEKFLSQMEISPAQGLVQVFLVNPKEIPAPGDRIRIFGRLGQPRPVRNPGEMNYKEFLAQKEIYATFSGLGTPAMRTVVPAAKFSWAILIHRLRGLMAGRIDRAFGAKTQASSEAVSIPALLKALLLGLRAQLPEELWNQMIKTGTAHLVAIAGLHMTGFTTAFFLLLIALRFSQRQAALTALLFSLFYMGIAGFGIPVQRAALMGAAVYAAILWKREVQSMNLLFLACFLILAIDPQALVSVSFQLSFLSVFSLLCLPARKTNPLWIEPFRISLAILAGTLPAAAYHFHRVSWVGLIANLWAIPLFSNALLSGMLLMVFADVPLAGYGLAKLCAWNLELGLWGIRIISRFPAGNRIVAQPDFLKMLIYYLMAAGWLAAPRLFSGKPLRVWRMLFLTGWSLSAASFFLTGTDSDFSVTLLASPKKILAHVRQGRREWLINPGAVYPVNLTQKLVIPYLHFRGIQHLDGVLLTGVEPGRIKALSNLLKEIDVSAVYAPLPEPSTMEKFRLAGKKHPAWKRLSLEQGIGNGNAGFSVRAFLEREKFCALEIRKPPFVMLLAENIDAQVLRTFCERYQNIPDLQLCLALYGHAAEPSEEAGANLKKLVKSLPLSWLILPEKVPPFPEAILSQAGRVFFLSETGAIQIDQEPRAGRRSSIGLYPFTDNGVRIDKPLAGLFRLSD